MTDDVRQDGRVKRVSRGIISPTAFYLLAFAVLTLLVLSLFNPSWGAEARAWPHEVFSPEGGFTWDASAAAAVAVLGILVTVIIGVLLRPGRTRGALVLFGVAWAASAYTPSPDGLSDWILPLATGWVGGCLLTQGGRRRKAMLLVGLAILAANLFMPWPEGRILQSHLPPGYHSTATVQFQVLTNPTQDLLEFMPEDGGEVERNVVKGYARIAVMTLPTCLGLLMLILGLLAVFGLTGGWARWVAGPLLLLAPLIVGYVVYDAGTSQVVADADLASWQLGLQYWAGLWPFNAMAWLLALVPAVADLSRPRQP